ncbi:TPA: hypothetical protein ACS7XC_000638 [Providencia alcalifaciens]
MSSTNKKCTKVDGRRRKPAFIATKMGYASSKMVHDVYGAWMTENNVNQITILDENTHHYPIEQ